MSVRQPVVLQHFTSAAVLSWQRLFGISDNNKENLRKTQFEHVNSNHIPLACDHSNPNRQDFSSPPSFPALNFQVEFVKA